MPFDGWVGGMADPEAVARLRRLRLEAPPTVASFSDIQTSGDDVQSFKSPKGLIQAIRVD